MFSILEKIGKNNKAIYLFVFYVVIVHKICIYINIKFGFVGKILLELGLTELTIILTPILFYLFKYPFHFEIFLYLNVLQTLALTTQLIVMHGLVPGFQNPRQQAIQIYSSVFVVCAAYIVDVMYNILIVLLFIIVIASDFQSTYEPYLFFLPFRVILLTLAITGKLLEWIVVIVMQCYVLRLPKNR